MSFKKRKEKEKYYLLPAGVESCKNNRVQAEGTRRRGSRRRRMSLHPEVKNPALALSFGGRWSPGWRRGVRRTAADTRDAEMCAAENATVHQYPKR